MATAPATLLAVLLSLAPGEGGALGLVAPGLDAAAVESGLRARVGDDLDVWSIEVVSLGGGGYRVELHGPDGRSETRDLTLDGTTDEDRSRELASTLALIIESSTTPNDQDDQDDQVPEQVSEGEREPPDPKVPKVMGQLALEAHTALGRPGDPDPELGLGLMGGAFVLHQHVQPRVGVRWSRSWSGPLHVDQISARLGVAAGAKIGRFWFGSLIMPALQWTRAEQVRVASSWSFGGEGSLMGQIRHERMVIGLRSGVEASFPAQRVLGTRDTIRWGHLRWLLVLEIGLLL